MTTIRHSYRTTVLAIAWTLGLWPVSVSAEKPEPDLQAGKAAFEQSCSRCHGVEGKGDGRDAKRLFPRPRDLTSGVFKFRSTASNTAPTDDDLFATLDHGLNAGGMPDWSQLDEQVRWQLIYYIKSLSPVFKNAPPEPITLSKDPGHGDPEKGKQLFEKLGCVQCHGANGRANGPSAPAFKDQWDRALRPADLTYGWSYRSGNDAKAIATRLVAGIDGAGMPSYAEAVTSPDDVWQLAYYVRSLQVEPRWTSDLVAKYVAGPLPDSADDPRWQQTPVADVRMRNAVTTMGEINAPLTTPLVTIRAVHDDSTIAFLLIWHDATEDHSGTPDTFALALRPNDLAGDVISLHAWPLRNSPSLDLCVWSGAMLTGGLQEALVDQIDLIPQGKLRGMPLSGQAVYADGEWKLVIQRPLVTQGMVNRGARFSVDTVSPVGFMIWDGGNEGQRAASSWLDLILEAGPGAKKAEHGEHAPKPKRAAEKSSASGAPRRASMPTRTAPAPTRQPLASERVAPEPPAREARAPSTTRHGPDRSVLLVWSVSAIVLVVALWLAVRRP